MIHGKEEKIWNRGHIFFFCVLAVCNPDCDQGDCTAPDECTCHKGWTGSICDQRKYQT